MLRGGIMHFWEIKSLATELNEHKIGIPEAMFYAIISTVLFGLGLSVVSWLPMLYHFSFSIIKRYLEKQADPAPLNIIVFNHLDYIFVVAKIALVIGGILFCLFVVNYAQLYTRMKRIICLSVPVNIRYVVWTTILFFIILLILTLYFGIQLSQFSETTAKNGVGRLFSKISPAALIKSGWSQWMNFKKAQVIFDDINVVSYIIYLTSHVISLMATGLMFFIIAANSPGQKD